MQRAVLIGFVCLGLLAGCASAPDETPTPPDVQPAGPPEVESATTVTGPAPVATASGATMDVPDSFRATSKGNVVELVEPDGAVEVYVVELSGQDMAAAVAAAWKQVDPDFAFTVEQAIDPPATPPWDAVRVETNVKGADGVFSQAVARRKGDTVWVAIIRGPIAALDKRGAQLRTFLGSLKVPGADEENLADVAPGVMNEGVLDAFITDALSKTGTPGYQIAVVEDGKVVFSKGYGVRELGKADTVTPDTLMMIGSVSKSMTTLMMAALVDQGKLDWEATAQSVYPSFKLGDDALGASLKVEQLVCACAGLPRKDVPLILEFEGKGADDVFSLLAKLEPSTGLGETYQYQNQMVAAGGYIAAHAFDPKAKDLGEAYGAAMDKLVFGPMGMGRTTTDHDAAMADANRATPHSQDLEQAHKIVSLEHERFAASVSPSGGIWSTANDMSKYVITELNQGESPTGARVASAVNHTRRWEKQVAIADKVYYGLGWVVADKKGLRKIQHGGGTMGFATLVVFYPEKNRGVVMISNGTGGHTVSSFVDALLFEMWFGADEKIDERFQFSLDITKKAGAELLTRTVNPDAEFMKSWLGTHEHPEVGTFIIRAEKGGYVLDAGEYKTALTRHDRPDGKSALLFVDPPLAGLELLPVEGGEGAFEMIRGQEKYVFTRR